MNLLEYAPTGFKEHLKALDNTARFNSARIRCELGFSSSHLHYVLTGNEGVGIPEAVQEIYERLKGIYGVSEYAYYDAIAMYDFNEGYVSAMADIFKDDTLICIGNAERLGMRGHTNNKTGMEELCNKMSGMTNSVVVLTGKNSQLVELVKGHEKAREWFPYIFRFEDLTPEALFHEMVEYVNSKSLH